MELNVVKELKEGVLTAPYRRMKAWNNWTKYGCSVMETGAMSMLGMVARIAPNSVVEKADEMACKVLTATSDNVTKLRDQAKDIVTGPVATKVPVANVTREARRRVRHLLQSTLGQLFVHSMETCTAAARNILNKAEQLDTGITLMDGVNIDNESLEKVRKTEPGVVVHMMLSASALPLRLCVSGLDSLKKGLVYAVVEKKSKRDATADVQPRKVRFPPVNLQGECNGQDVENGVGAESSPEKRLLSACSEADDPTRASDTDLATFDLNTYLETCHSDSDSDPNYHMEEESTDEEEYDSADLESENEVKELLKESGLDDLKENGDLKTPPRISPKKSGSTPSSHKQKSNTPIKRNDQQFEMVPMQDANVDVVF